MNRDRSAFGAALLAGLLGAMVALPEAVHAQGMGPTGQAPVFAIEDFPEPPPVDRRDFGEVERPRPFAPIDVIDIPPVMPGELGGAPVIASPHPETLPPRGGPPSTAVANPPVLVGEAPGPVAASIASILAAPPAAAKQTQAALAQHAALAAFYAERGNAPVWIENGRLGPRARAAIARLKAAADDGLDPDAFATPQPDIGERTSPSADELAMAELNLSRAALLYAQQAQAGRLVPRALSPLLTAAPPTLDPLAALRTIGASADVAATLDSFNPSHPGFRALKAKLAELRQREPVVDTTPIVPAGAVMRPGAYDPRVPLLRERMKQPWSASELYDDDLAKAVQAFQKAQGFVPDGLLGAKTVAALNDRRHVDPVPDIIANMERWRWLPRDLGATHVFVNIPEFELKIVRGGLETYRTRVVVGKPSNQTPVFSNQIAFVIVNPFWHVPNSIAVKEMLPNIRNDPGSLARQGFEVVQVNGKRAEVVNPYSIDWSTTNLKNLQFRQLPGERNALGRIKFMFPNEHSVYLHDTPSRSLFARDMRALSHGCVRVDQPLQFGESLLGPEGMTAKKLGGLIGGPERRVNVRTPIPVHLAYFTVGVDEQGNLQTRRDIYGHDKLVKRALGLEGIATAAN